MYLRASETGLELSGDDVNASVPPRIIISLMHRYGREADDGVDLRGEELRLNQTCVLRRVRFRAAVDAIGRDYLALLEDGREPLLAMATTIAGALAHLARAKSA